VNLSLQLSEVNASSTISIAGSKSETNRLLLLQALYPNIKLLNLSNSDDSDVMREAIQSSAPIIDIHHAGTAMRFLTAYFAMQEGREVILTGSNRMKERPIKILVEALQELGADIEYQGKHGFPPLRIKGKRLTHSKVSLDAQVSSQYISALLLMAPKLEHGIQLTLQGELTSVPYIKMTLALLNQIGVKTICNGNQIAVLPSIVNHQPTIITIESDWSSASYFYSIVALSQVGKQITLSNFKKDSLQGDRVVADIYRMFGVETTFNDDSITLTKINYHTTINSSQPITLQLSDTPDLAQTIAVTCFGLGLGCSLTGLHTLKIKETNRLQALQNELTKLGATVTITDDSLSLLPAKKIQSAVTIQTYNDHRMALAFAPLALKVPLVIANAEVVAKSYPDYWNDLKSIGFRIN
jgi:3-phosphoshikimate 1-carboxyvinyltransferase